MLLLSLLIRRQSCQSIQDISIGHLIISRVVVSIRVGVCSCTGHLKLEDIAPQVVCQLLAERLQER
eukprot:655361-Alexandrium_andersonii.AAC.1